MALPSIITGKPSGAREQLADLQARVNAQGLEIARLSREVASLRGLLSQMRERPIVTRSGCALIADRLGINERTVRKVLVESPHFARVRALDTSTPITRNAAFLTWLADNLDSAWPK